MSKIKGDSFESNQAEPTKEETEELKKRLDLGLESILNLIKSSPLEAVKTSAPFLERIIKAPRGEYELYENLGAEIQKNHLVLETEVEEVIANRTSYGNHKSWVEIKDDKIYGYIRPGLLRAIRGLIEKKYHGDFEKLTAQGLEELKAGKKEYDQEIDDLKNDQKIALIKQILKDSLIGQLVKNINFEALQSSHPESLNDLLSQSIFVLMGHSEIAKSPDFSEEDRSKSRIKILEISKKTLTPILAWLILAAEKPKE